MNLTDALKEIAIKIAQQMKYEIYDLTLKRNRGKLQLAVSIDKEEGNVSIEDCKRFSEAFGQKLDCADLIESTYELIVQSPGVERELRKPKDYLRFTGRLAKLVLRDPIDNRSVIVGIIEKADETAVEIREKDTGNFYGVAYANIKRANLKLEF
ncbi:ribosome maturation factor RimP [Kosmotoga pacifica]|uniref:ribosome maturation factor RimP n=1 Tax=Kosmotoga pacifica TaxID=1330330 RepID=UPI00069B9DAA|nr:ribosome maturation factor RimP [Kosmotoga pacifica]